MQSFTYLIIGNSAGAVGAVESIRTIDRASTIGIVSDERHHIYARPRISDRVLANVGADSIAYRPMDFYDKNSVTTILGEKVVAINTADKTVRTEDGDILGYEKLLLTTGATPARPPIPGLDLLGVHYFVTWDQADSLAGVLEDVQQIVVIGGGLIGMQAAEALCRVGKEVTVIEMLDRVLALSLDEHTSGMVTKLFDEHGVRILTSTRVQEIKGDTSRVSSVALADGMEIPCQAVVMAAGVTPRTELAKNAGLNLRRGICVNEFMQTSAPDVYAAGDVAEARDLLSGEDRLCPIWPNAYMEGRAAGAAMAGRPVPYSGGLSINSAHFFDFPISAAGILQCDEACTEILDSNEKTGYYRRIILKDNVPIGMVLAGDAVDRGGVILGLIRNQTDVSQFIDKLAFPDFTLASLPADMRRTKQQGKEKI